MNAIHEGRDQWPDVGNGDLPCCMGVAVVTGRSVFACHVGMRRVVAWQHPIGARLGAMPGDYHPLIVDGIAYQADGSPAFACAGQRAMRIAAQRAGGSA